MHFYEKGSGQPRYEVAYKDPSKGMRRATIADARKHGWLPSVTTVLDILDKPALNRWKVGQAVGATYGKQKAEDEPFTRFTNRCIEESKKVTREAAQRGTRVHDLIEKLLTAERGSFETDKDEDEILGAVWGFVMHYISDRPGYWNVESYFGDKRGFGGKVDFHVKIGNPVVIDWKTKEFTSEDNIKGWPEQCRQLAAYAHGLGIPKARLINVFVSVTEPGLIVPYEWTPEQARQGWKEFEAILNCYQIINRMK